LLLILGDLGWYASIICNNNLDFVINIYLNLPLFSFILNNC
jgi:hypothetical protein